MEETSNCINIISFTEKGEALAKRLSTYLFQSQQKDQADCECDRDLIKCISKCRASKSYSAIRLSECAKESFEKKTWNDFYWCCRYCSAHDCTIFKG